MDDEVKETLSYTKGYLALTETHLLVVRDGYLAEKLALQHLVSLDIEEAHSFRHRVGGMVAAAVLLGLPALVLLVPDGFGILGVLAFFRGKVGLGIFFSLFFGLLFLWGVVRSRRIWWLHARYEGTLKLIPLPTVEPEALARFVEALQKEMRLRS